MRKQLLGAVVSFVLAGCGPAGLNNAPPRSVAPAAASASGTVQDATAAIAWAASNPINPNTGDHNWYFWCLGLVNSSWKNAGHVIPELQAPTARAAYDNFVRSGAVIHNLATETPPKGAAVFWDYVQSGTNYGHIAIA